MVWDTQQQLPDYTVGDGCKGFLCRNDLRVCGSQRSLHNCRINDVGFCLAGVNTDVHRADVGCGGFTSQESRQGS